MRDGHEEESSGEGPKKMLGAYEVYKRIVWEFPSMMTLEQKPEEMRDQILWLSGVNILYGKRQDYDWNV